MSTPTIPDHFAVKKTKRIAHTPKHQVFGKSLSSSSASTSRRDEQAGTSTAPTKDDIEILKEFDMNHEFGPCIGVSRLQRWENAHKFGLNPPENIRQIILDHQNDAQFTECVWYDYAL